MKKIILVMIVFLMVIGSLYSIGLPPSAGDGTQDNPYILSELAHLGWLSETEEAWGDSLSLVYYILDNDIDASETKTWNNSSGLQPIGYVKSIEASDAVNRKSFYGIFDGKNHTISNLYINTTGTDYQTTGFFGTFENSTISNLKIENATIIGRDLVGTLVGSAGNSSITNCSIQSTIEGNSGVGALVGIIANSNIEQVACTFTISAVSNVGGLTSLLNKSKVKNSFLIGEITSSKAGPAGGVSATMLNSTLENCYLSSTINSPNSGSISNMAMNSNVTGFICNKSLYAYDYFASDVRTKISDSRALSFKRMKLVKSYLDLGWDFDSVWTISSDKNQGLPYLH